VSDLDPVDLQPVGRNSGRLRRTAAAVRVVIAMAVAGVLLGAVWAWLAPPLHGVVALTRSGERVFTYLGSESDHQFEAAFLAMAIPMVFAVIATVLVWQWRAPRGPMMLVGVTAGAAAAAAAAAGVGAWIVHMRYGAIDIDAAPVTENHRIHYVVEAPPVFFGHTGWQIAATMLVPAATAALVYALFAVAAERDDLGGLPAIDPVRPPVAAAAPTMTVGVEPAPPGGPPLT